MQCPKCGFNNPENAKYCQKCANIFGSAPSQPSQSPAVLSDHQPNIQVMSPDVSEGIKYRNRSAKKIILIVILILLIGGLAFAGYYYKDKVVGLFSNNNAEESLGQNIGQEQKVNEQKQGEEKIKNTESDYDKLILNTDEVRAENIEMGLSEADAEKIVIDQNDSRQIKTVFAFNNIFNKEPEWRAIAGNYNPIIIIEYAVVGGFYNSFIMKGKTVAGEELALPVLKSGVMELSNTGEAEKYLNDIDTWIQNYNKKYPVATFRYLDGVGEKCIVFRDLGNAVFVFRMGNYIGLIVDEISSPLDTRNDIFIKAQANKMQTIIR
jgi:hypothetical protein